MEEVRDKTVGDFCRELKLTHLWSVLVALCLAFSGVFWWGYNYSDRANSGKIAALESRLDTILKYDIPSLSEGKLAVPCPRKQYEIVKFYGELSSAVRSGDRDRIRKLYHERFNGRGLSRNDVVRMFDPLLGHEIVFEVTSLRYAEGETVAASVTCVLSQDECMYSRDTLIRDESGWRFIN